MRWTKPNGQSIETNDNPGTIKACNKLGWVQGDVLPGRSATIPDPDDSGEDGPADYPDESDLGENAPPYREEPTDPKPSKKKGKNRTK